ncbi:MAG: hypothetical protein ACLUNV_11615 [Sutterella wadsworthensis]
MAPLAFEDDRAVSPQGDHAGRAAVAQAEAGGSDVRRKDDVLLDHLDEAAVEEHALGDGRFSERIVSRSAGSWSLKLG